MQTNSILKIWLLSVNFEKFTSINVWEKCCNFSPHARHLWLGCLPVANFTRTSCSSSDYALKETLDARTLILVCANNRLYRHLFQIIHYCLFVMRIEPALLKCWTNAHTSRPRGGYRSYLLSFIL